MADEETQGTFVVTHADENSAVVRDVTDGQVHTLADNPGVETEEVLEATLAPEPPLEVAYTVVDIAGQRTIPIERSPETPTKQARDLAAAQDVGDITREERAGDGQLHVITVPEDQTDQAATDVLEDEATLTRAARMGVARVEVRADAGVVSVRYLPD